MSVTQHQRLCPFCQELTLHVYSWEDAQWQCTRCTRCTPASPRVHLPRTSLAALVKALSATEGNQNWVAMLAADAILATLNSQVHFFVRLLWTDDQRCTGLYLHVPRSDGTVQLLAVPFAEVFPAYPELYWDGAAACWRGYDRPAPDTVERAVPTMMPVRAVLIATLAQELALLQFEMGGDFDPASALGQKYAQGSFIVAGLACGTGEEEKGGMAPGSRLRQSGSP